MSVSAAIETFVNNIDASAAAYLDSCVHCGQCAQACHFYETTGDVRYTPVWKLEPMRRVYKRHKAPLSGIKKMFGLVPDEVDEDMLKEWEISRDILSEIIDDRVYCASIPGGEMNFNSQVSAHEAGFKFLFTSEPTLKPWRSGSVVNFGRVYPKKGSSLSKVLCLARHKCYFREIVKRKFKNFIKKFYYLFKSNG